MLSLAIVQVFTLVGIHFMKKVKEAGVPSIGIQPSLFVEAKHPLDGIIAF